MPLNTWVADNDMTPYLLVDAEQKDVSDTNRNLFKDGQIVRISAMSCGAFIYYGQRSGLSFGARLVV